VALINIKQTLPGMSKAVECNLYFDMTEEGLLFVLKDSSRCNYSSEGIQYKSQFFVFFGGFDMEYVSTSEIAKIWNQRQYTIIVFDEIFIMR